MNGLLEEFSSRELNAAPQKSTGTVFGPCGETGFGLGDLTCEGGQGGECALGHLSPSLIFPGNRIVLNMESSFQGYATRRYEKVILLRTNNGISQ